MAQFKRKTILTYDRSFYRFADTARQIPNPRVEYRKLRNAALNRIRKLEKAGYGDSETVQKARRVFEDLPRNLSQDEAAQRLPDAARFIESARGTVGGMREIERKTVETLQDRGFDFVNRRNVRAFTQFLDWLGQEKALFIPYMAEALFPREGGAERKPVSIELLQESFETWKRENDY
jgi:hypothetical protein